MKVFVSGASGFIGSALVEELMRRGHTVTACVREASKANALNTSSIAVVEEIGPDTDWGDVLSGHDVVVNLAARVHVMEDRDPDPLASFRRVNVDGLRSLLEAADSANVKRIIALSSIKAIGEDSADLEFLNDETLENPIDLYGKSKLEADQMLRTMAEKSNMGWTVLRPPLVYGSGVRGNFLTLLNACARRKLLPIGNIKNQRSMIYLGNLVDAICVSVEIEAPLNDIFLIDDGAPVSTPDLVRNISNALGVKPRLMNVPLWMLRVALILLGKRAIADRLMKSLVLDSQRFQKAAGWTPPYKMVQGLAETASWYKSSDDL